ncbi:hypothetical protein LCGC14_2854280, partial [marine sediment metagenome]
SIAEVLMSTIVTPPKLLVGRRYLIGTARRTP